jgi:hypothetical protein
MKRCALALLLMCTYAQAQGGVRVVVLANSIDGNLAGGLYQFLADNHMSVVKADSNVFGIVKDSPYIVVLGGQNSPEGVGDLSAQAIPDERRFELLVPEASMMFERDSVWAPRQKVYVFAGYGADDTLRAWIDNKGALIEAINSTVSSGIVLFAPQTVAFDDVSNVREYSFPINITNSGLSAVSDIEPKAYLNGGVALAVEPAKMDLGEGESGRFLVKINPKKVATGDTVSFEAQGQRLDVKINVTGYVKAGLCQFCLRGD